MAQIINLSNILNRPVGEVETQELNVLGNQVTVTLTNFDDYVDLQVKGTSEFKDLCARCAKDVTVTVPFESSLKVKDVLTEKDVEDGVLALNRHAGIDIEKVVSEAIELSRPTLVYCAAHKSKPPKTFVIE